MKSTTAQKRKSAKARGKDRVGHSCALPLFHSGTLARRAFTLIELLVSIGIFLLITAMTLAMVNVSANRDRVRGAARQLQSVLEGARNRAIYTTRNSTTGVGESRGVRFLLDPNSPLDSAGLPTFTATSMVYIGASAPKSGTMRVGNPTNPLDTTDKRTLYEPTNTVLAEWTRLQQRGLLPSPPNVIYVSFKFGTNFQLFTAVGTGTNWQLTKDFSNSPAELHTDHEYRLQLLPSVLPSQEPALLPRNVVIDLPRSFVGPVSHLPRSWGAVPFSGPLDIMFSPQGSMTGPDASGGLVHLVLRETIDVVNGRTLGDTNDPQKVGDEMIVTITPSTGNVSTHPVYPDIVTPDVFRYAETGEVAK